MFSQLEGHHHVFTAVMPPITFSSMEMHLVMICPVEGNARGHFIVFSPMQGNSRGHVITCPQQEGHP